MSLERPQNWIQQRQVPGLDQVSATPGIRLPYLGIEWGAESAAERGPVIGTTSNPALKNVIGTHAGPWATYRGLSIAAQELSPAHRMDLSFTDPMGEVAPNPSWYDKDAIVTMDPWGHLVKEQFAALLAQGYNIQPTIAITKAKLDIPELQEKVQSGEIPIDGNVVLQDGGVLVTKAAIDQVWHLPGMARRMGVEESVLRAALAKELDNPILVERPDLEVFLPPIPGHTLYIFGDPETLSDPGTKLTARVHDACHGSDTMGSDICTCRPYLMHGVEEAVIAAQAGENGLIQYNAKEGRALGEVVKYLVYGKRKQQPDGDSPERYFAATAEIAGVEDARFQMFMPDILRWAGVTRIDRHHSMSDMKAKALEDAGIRVVEQVDIPADRVPEDAKVELKAKIDAGYNAEEVSVEKGTGRVYAAGSSRELKEARTRDLMAELRSPRTIRDRANYLLERALNEESDHFVVRPALLQDVVDRVTTRIQEKYPDGNVPLHSIWRHLERLNDNRMERLDEALAEKSRLDRAKAKIDIAMLTTALNAGMGPTWVYQGASGEQDAYRSSEGVAAAVLDAFLDGAFSANPLSDPLRVDGKKIREMSQAELEKILQHGPGNEVSGMERRHQLLQSLGEALLSRPEYFGKNDQRPGDLLDYLWDHAKAAKGQVSIHAATLLTAVLDGTKTMWPNDGSLESLDGEVLGDVGRHSKLESEDRTAGLMPFHKLGQFFTLSLIEPLEEAGMTVKFQHRLTVLPEYRNGGLLVDTDVLLPKDPSLFIMPQAQTSEAIVEWRALTVAILEEVGHQVRERLGKTEEELPMARLLEGGTWHAGRELAFEKREDGSSPIRLQRGGLLM